MNFSGSTPAHEQVAAAIRNLIATQLHIKLKRVTDGARFVDDLAPIGLIVWN
jgi:hypothetical protein